MSKIPQNSLHDKMPLAQLQDRLRTLAEPVTLLLPDARVHEVTHLLLQGLVTAESPIVTPSARGTAHHEPTLWLTCKRLYRCWANERFSHRTWRQGLYHLAQQVVTEQAPPYLVIAVDPLNFEKPSTQPWEGVSQVYKSTPPTLTGEKRITRGYPAITAPSAKLQPPATTYANGLKTTYLAGSPMKPLT